MTLDRIREDLNAKGSYEQAVTLTFTLTAPVCAQCLAELIGDALAPKLAEPPWALAIDALCLSLPPGSLLAPHHGDAAPPGETVQ